MKILAIDFGLKRMGFAIGNTLLGTATPLDTFERKNSRQAVDHIKNLVSEYDISLVLLGYPLHMDGTKSHFTEQVEHFKNRLKKAFTPGVEVDLADERLSSFEAEEELKSFQPDYRKRKKILDSMSAMVFLRRYMENIET